MSAHTPRGAADSLEWRNDSPAPSRKVVAAFFLVAALVLFAFLGSTPLTRTQEARVLVTAREMYDLGGPNWLLPRMNGQLRLQKPPLMYWIDAAAFAVLGVSEFAGRLPSVLAGLALLAVVYRTAARMIAPSAGLVAASTLLGSMLAFRFMRQAETDGLLTLLLTAAIALFLRASDALIAVDEMSPGSPPPSARGSPRRDLAFASLCIGLAFIAKGLPAAFGLLFLVALTVARRQPRLLLTWFKAAGPIVVLAVALPWYVYLHSTVGLDVVFHEVDMAASGETHRNPIYFYLFPLCYTPLPFTPLAFLAGGVLIARARIDGTAVALLVWLASILVPLHLIGQKQYHYLVPLMPPMALSVAWLVHRARTDAALRPLVQNVTGGIAAVCLVAGFALPFIARLTRGDLMTVDLVLAGILISGGAAAWRLSRKALPHGVIALGLTAAAAWALFLGRWSGSFDAPTPRDVAQELRTLGDGPYVFVDNSMSVSLLFAMKQIIPQVGTADLDKWLEKYPNLVAILKRSRKDASRLIPGFVVMKVVELDDNRFELLTADKERR